MYLLSTLVAFTAASSAFAHATAAKRQYTGQPGYPKAVVFVAAYNNADRTADTYTTVEIPLGYGLTSSNTPALQKVSYISFAGSDGNVDPLTVDCVTDAGVHFNASVPLPYSDEPTELKSVLCRQG